MFDVYKIIHDIRIAENVTGHAIYKSVSDRVGPVASTIWEDHFMVPDWRVRSEIRDVILMELTVGDNE